MTEETTPEETAASEPRFITAGDTFIARGTTEGDIRIPLRFKVKLLRQIREIEDPLDQLFALLDGVGDQQAVAQIDELDTFEAAALVEAFFDAYQSKEQARLGELRRSSSS